MTTLRSAIVLILASIAAPALAEQITCESRGDRTEACGTVQPGSTVRLQQQISNSPCVEGRTWGSDNASIWVSGGCRAVFDVTPPYERTARSGYGSRHDEGDRDNDGYSDEEDRRGNEHHEQYASAGHGHMRARNACIDAAASGRSFGPDEVRADDVRWLGEGLFAVHLSTPDGSMRCTVDREGNVRSLHDR